MIYSLILIAASAVFVYATRHDRVAFLQFLVAFFALGLYDVYRRISARYNGHPESVDRTPRAWVISVVTVAGSAWLQIAVFRSVIENISAGNWLLHSFPAQLFSPMFVPSWRGLLLAVVTTLGSALLEEVVFRGFLQDGLFRILRNKYISSTLVALVFSLLHNPANTVHGLMFFTFSLLMSYLVGAVGLAGAAVVHALYNLPLVVDSGYVHGGPPQVDRFTVDYSSELSSLYVGLLAIAPLFCLIILWSVRRFQMSRKR